MIGGTDKGLILWNYNNCNNNNKYVQDSNDNIIYSNNSIFANDYIKLNNNDINKNQFIKNNIDKTITTAKIRDITSNSNGMLIASGMSDGNIILIKMKENEDKVNSTDIIFGSQCGRINAHTVIIILYIYKYIFI
jgi:hypothetical protein